MSHNRIISLSIIMPLLLTACSTAFHGSFVTNTYIGENAKKLTPAKGLALPFTHKSPGIYTPAQQIPIAQDLKVGIPLPHYLMPRRRIVVASQVPTKRGYK